MFTQRSLSSGDAARTAGVACAVFGCGMRVAAPFAWILETTWLAVETAARQLRSDRELARMKARDLADIGIHPAGY